MCLIAHHRAHEGASDERGPRLGDGGVEQHERELQGPAPEDEQRQQEPEERQTDRHHDGRNDSGFAGCPV